MTPDHAEAVAIEALAYIAADEGRLARFIDLTGHRAGAIRHATRQPGFLAGVLHHVVG